MEERVFRSIQEVNEFITECVMNDEPVPQWAKDQRMQLLEIERNGGVTMSKTPIYDTMKRNAKFPFTDEKKACIETTVEKLLEEGPKAEEPGLLLGKIQCGKTDTFENIIGLAFDKGIDIAIIMTKGTNALVQQTIKRLQKDFAPFQYDGTMSGKPVVDINDIMGDIRGGMIKANVDRMKNIIVCKKETQNMKVLTELFEVHSPFLKDKKVLIVDDEADFASRNYHNVQLDAITDDNGDVIPQKNEKELAKIAQQIDDFRKVPSYCRYLQVTATPYCLFLQPGGDLNLNGTKVKGFKPRFTSIVPTHSAYIGGKEYFEESENEESMYSLLFHSVEQKCLDILGKQDKRYINSGIASKNLYDLTYALVSYFTATAIRMIQERKNNRDYRSSAILHIKVDKKTHEWQEKIINRLMRDISKCFVENDQTDLRIWTAIDACYEDFKKSNEKGRNEKLINVEMPSKEAIIDEIKKLLESEDYNIQIINSDEQLPLNDDGELKQKASANIFIGANILDRGITIKNMLLFFYGRNPGNFQQDTVLQHARMYGARSKEDMAVTRMFTSQKIYGILKNMNELDNQLRDWVEHGKYDTEDYPTFVGFSKNIRPCAASKIKASNALTLKPEKRILPVGIWPGTKTQIGKIVEKIDQMIMSSPHYHEQDTDGFFEMDKQLVVDIINQISKTYIYHKDYDNMMQKNDLNEFLCSLEYSTHFSDGKVWALHRTNRDVSRIRENGYWVDAPDDGRTDTAPSRRKAQGRPVVMFIRENGSKTQKGERWTNSSGEYIGWSGTPFYWPVLVMQSDIKPVMYAIEPEKQKWASVFPLAEFLGSVNPKEVLRLRVCEYLKDTYGAEGTEYSDEETMTFTRPITDTTAKRFIQTDDIADGSLMEKADADVRHGVYSFNNGQFPYELRPYRYLLLNKKDMSGSEFMLIELCDVSEWKTYCVQNFTEEGDLVGDDGRILLHGRDILVDKTLDEEDDQETDVCQWFVEYKLKCVAKYQFSTTNWDAIEETE